MRDAMAKRQHEFQQRRQSLHLTQSDLAQRLHCSTMAVCYAESGRRSTGRVARELARLLFQLESSEARRR